MAQYEHEDVLILTRGVKIGNSAIRTGCFSCMHLIIDTSNSPRKVRELLTAVAVEFSK